MEQRRAPRRRVLKAGTIEFGRSALSCVVRDRSDTGAKLDVPSPIGIPDQFDLVTDGSRAFPAASHGAKQTESGSRSVKGRVSWRSSHPSTFAYAVGVPVLRS